MSKLHEGTFVQYYGKYNEWRVYRAADGILIGYRSKTNKDGGYTGLERVVTNTKDPDKFGDFVDRHSAPVKRYNPHKDANQLKIT